MDSEDSKLDSLRYESMARNIASARAIGAHHDADAKQRLLNRALELRTERKKWEAENPEINEAWGEAVAEDATRQKVKWAEQCRLGDLRQAGLQEREIEALKKKHHTAAIESVQAFLDSKQIFLLLVGSPGTGKSIAAAYAVDQMHEQFPVFVAANRCARLSCFNENDLETFQTFKETKLLVLDDLGAELLHDGWRPLLDELIDARYRGLRKTIITTNLSAEGFVERYGARIHDRIRHNGIAASSGSQSLRTKAPKPE